MVPSGDAGHGLRPYVRTVDEIGYVYVRVADQVEEEIRSGLLSQGARLPNERDLGAQYGVAPGTARRAVAELRDRGLVVTLPNKGTYVVGQQDAPPSGEDGA
jgi:DNA-binding GntR family transcriptional regulator